MKNPWVKWALYIVVGGWVVGMLLGGLVMRLLVLLRPPKARMCPKCGYAEVYDIGFRRPQRPGKTPTSYAMCRACKRRYKHWGAGPFHAVDEDEWLAVMRRPFG